MVKVRASVPLHKIAEELVRLGIIKKEALNDVYRIIIDLDVNNVPLIYVQMFGESDITDQLPELVRSMFGKDKDATQARSTTEPQDSNPGT